LERARSRTAVRLKTTRLREELFGNSRDNRLEQLLT
jgi:hypothetical protein